MGLVVAPSIGLPMDAFVLDRAANKSRSEVTNFSSSRE
jgi:hypothetical protein